MTRHLYLKDSYLCTFQATVVSTRKIDDRQAVILDASAFYPTSGGQPHDTGTLDGIRVIDAQTLDDEVVHVLDGTLDGGTVCGNVDWSRRFDHMQQHSGQHILSQAFLRVLEAETVGFHLGEDASTIDLDRAPIGQDQVSSAEKLANEIVLDNRPIIARFVDERELATLPLRKLPAVEGPIRIVQVSGFDWSPCGGTHVRASGEVGPIKVVQLERRKQKTRVHFLCGWRALSDYRHKQDIVQHLIAHFTTSEDEILAAVERLEAEAKRLGKALSDVQTQLLEHEAAGWIAQAQMVGNVRVVRQVFEERDLSLLKKAARSVTARPGTVAFLATRGPSAHIVFARSQDVPLDVGGIMRTVCAAVGGRGGGSPQLAQGGIPRGGAVDRALDVAMEQLAAT